MATFIPATFIKASSWRKAERKSTRQGVRQFDSVLKGHGFQPVPQAPQNHSGLSR